MEMETDTKNIKLRVQETLDELFSERLIPFALTAHKVNADGPGEYVVPFYDSRIHSFSFSWSADGSFKEIVRAAVLDRVNRMSGSSGSLTLKTLLRGAKSLTTTSGWGAP
jgi:hypothetical protein